MKKNFSIIPVEGKKNEVEITLLKDFTLKVDKKDTVFVKFLMLLLHRAGGPVSYFAPLLGFTDHSFHNIKERVNTQGITSLFYPDISKQDAQKISDPDIGKVVKLIVGNPEDSNEKIAEKFNASSTNKITLRDVEEIRNKFGLKTS